jgi:hypothetical protein
MNEVDRASARATQLQLQLEQAQNDLRVAAHHLALTIRAMIKFYGFKNIHFLLRIPPRFKKVFAAFLIQETRQILANAEFSSDFDAAALRRFGAASFGDADNEDWLAELEEYEYDDVDPNEVYGDELFVGFLAPKVTPEDLKILKNLEQNARNNEQPVASSSKVTLD